jgi:hypothetical protein
VKEHLVGIESIVSMRGLPVCAMSRRRVERSWTEACQSVRAKVKSEAADWYFGTGMLSNVSSKAWFGTLPRDIVVNRMVAERY